MATRAPFVNTKYSGYYHRDVPEENEELIEEFLKEQTEFRVGLDSASLHKTFSTPKGYWASVPYEHKMDGVFAVKLIKSN